jgi:hypothetical protein
MKPERWVHEGDLNLVAPRPAGAIRPAGICIVGTNILAGDAASRFIAGDPIDEIAKDYEVTREHIEAAIRTVLRARKRYP